MTIAKDKKAKMTKFLSTKEINTYGRDIPKNKPKMKPMSSHNSV